VSTGDGDEGDDHSSHRNSDSHLSYR
jgi:hypothetical protein